MDYWRGLGYSLASYWDELMFIQNGTGAVMEVGSFRQAVISFFPSCEEEEEEACCCLLVTGNVLAWPGLSCPVLSCYYNYQKDDGLVNCSSNIILILFCFHFVSLLVTALGFVHCKPTPPHPPSPSLITPSCHHQTNLMPATTISSSSYSSCTFPTTSTATTINSSCHFKPMGVATVMLYIQVPMAW